VFQCLMVVLIALTKAKPTSFGIHLKDVLATTEIKERKLKYAWDRYGLCEGDCEIDEQCADGLRCFQRSLGGPMPPGCNGAIGKDVGSLSDLWENLKDAPDFCYDPKFDDFMEPGDYDPNFATTAAREIGLRLYFGAHVMSCYFGAAECVADKLLTCDINNMVTRARCDDDSMDEVTFELENHPHLALTVDYFQIDDTKIEYKPIDDTTTFTVPPLAVIEATVNKTSSRITDQVTTRAGAASELAMTMTTGVSQSDSKGIVPLDVELFRKDPDGVFYRYSCRHLVPYHQNPDAWAYFSCDSLDVDTRWYRQQCNAVGESVTFRVGSENNMYIDSFKVDIDGTGTNLDFFCVPDEWSAVGNTKNDTDCGCSGASSKWGHLSLSSRPDSYPVVTVSSDSSCSATEGLVSAASHRYTISVTTCPGSYANYVVLGVQAKGSNGNTVSSRIGSAQNGPSLAGYGGKTSFGIGHEDIGTLISIGFLPEDNDQNWPTNFCLKEIEWMDNVDGTSVILGEEQLGRGVFLVKDSPDLSKITPSPIEVSQSDLGWQQALFDLCEGDCNYDGECRGKLVCHQNQVPPGCSGTPPGGLPTDWDYCGLPTADDVSVPFQESTAKQGLYLPSTPYLFEVNLIESHHRTMIDVTVQICDFNEAFALKDDSTLTVSVAGRNVDGEFETTEALSLSTGSEFLTGSLRTYALNVPVQFSEVTVLSFAHNSDADVMCIDMVEVNGQSAYLSNTILSSSTSYCEGIMEECPTTLFAVISWPICNIELLSQRVEVDVVSTTESSAASMTCSNPNKLFEASCDIEEERAVTTTITETLEVSKADWSENSHSTFTESSNTKFTENSDEKSDGGSTGTSSETSGTETKGFSFSATASAEFGAGALFASATTSFSATAEVSGSLEEGWTEGSSSESSWSSSSSSTSGSEDTSTSGSEGTTGSGSEGTTTNSDETSTEKSETVACSGTASVPPLHSLTYSVTMSNAVIEYKTFSTLRFTKCSSSFVGDSDENTYLYLYNVPGSVVTSTGKSCSVEFGLAEYTAAAMDCADAAKMKAVEMADYVPVCHPTTPSKWEPCQCAFGDSRTEATCSCVDVVSGLPLDGANFAAAVVDTSPSSLYDHYSDWCEVHCPNSGYPGLPTGAPAEVPDDASAHTESAKVVAETECVGGECLVKEPVDGVDWKLLNMLLNVAMAVLFAVFTSFVAVTVYVVMKMCPRGQGSKYKPVASVDASDVDFA